MRYVIYVSFFLLLLLIPFTLFKPFSTSHPVTSNIKDLAPSKNTRNVASIKIAAVGDIMMHSPQMRAGLQSNGDYDFHSFFSEVKPFIQMSDVAIANLELTMAGKAYPFQGFPRFNSPDSIVNAIKDTGFDVVSTANNHSLDTGVKGLKRTYQMVKNAGLQPTGTATIPQERRATMVNKQGVKLAFLAYTESTNGLPIPKGEEYLINLLKENQIEKDIEEARKQGADLVSVSLHFGVEYQRKPSPAQRAIAHKVLESGADVVLGSHPHVLQPIEKVTKKGKDKLIIYSMGNFISNQFDPHTDEGVILYFDVEKDFTKKQTRIKNISYLPTYVHKYHKHGKRQYVILPIEVERPDYLLKYPELNLSKWRSVYQHTKEHMASMGTVPVFH